MRIGCLQFAPVLGDVDNNLNRADSLLNRAKTDDLDLIVLPEMAFSGYNFKNMQDIKPFLEHSGSGITSLWARTMALKYNCVLVVGYPEKVEVSSSSSMQSNNPEYYNSAIMVNEDGETIGNYRKNFLFTTDETWASEGQGGFFHGIVPGLGNVSLGICMDINPYKFEAPWHAFEFAFHVLEVDSNLVIISMAWITRDERSAFTSMPNEPDMDTLTYWVTRFEPLIRSDNEDEIIVVFCNRTGHEDDATYAGTSAVIGIQDGEVKVYGLLGRGEKELLVVDTNNPPFAKMVYRPDVPEREPTSLGLGKSADESGDSIAKSQPIKREERAAVKDTKNPASPADHQDSSSTNPTASVPVSSPVQANARKADHASLPQKKLPGNVSVPRLRENKDIDGPQIPTPSAPSPTPQAVRPRLIIPETPSMGQFPVSNSAVDSSVSIRSDMSFQSVRSNDSHASVSTVRSNPRPPEESTPHPDKAFRGYRNAVFPKGISTNGEVGALSPLDEFLTAFDGDISPMTARWFYQSPEATAQTPSASYAAVSPGGSRAAWSPGAPVGRQPEPFPWEAITGNPQSSTREPVSSRPHGEAVAPLNPRARPAIPRSNTSPRRPGNARQISSSSHPTGIKATAQDHYDKEIRANKSPWSKPPHTSKGVPHQRSNSALDVRDVKETISQYLDSMSPKTESARRNPASGSKAKSKRERLPKTVDTSAKHHDLIPIIASPSILTDDGRSITARAPSDAPSRGRLRQRSNSSTNASWRPLAENESRTNTPVPGNKTPKSSSRVTSHGRKPAPKRTNSDTGIEKSTQEIDRASSTDSTKTDRLYTRTERRDPAKQSHSRTSSTQRSRRPSEQEIINLERADVHVYTGFTMREQYSPSTATLTDVSTIHSGQSSTNSTPASSPDDSMIHDYSVIRGLPGNSPLRTGWSSWTGAKPSQGSPAPRPAPPNVAFNPDTPKAMVFSNNDVDGEPLHEELVDGQKTTPRGTRCGGTVTAEEKKLRKSPEVEAS